MAVGVLARFRFKDGNDPAVQLFFDNGLAVVETQPATTMWFAFRIGPDEFGAFACFADAEDREALLAAGGPKLAGQNVGLFASPPSFDRVDVILSRAATG